jgi:hypothetical protein
MMKPESKDSEIRPKRCAHVGVGSRFEDIGGP